MGVLSRGTLAPPIRMQRKNSPTFKERLKDIDIEKIYTLEEAVALVKKASYENFDASVEAHIQLGIDSKKSDQFVRGIAVLPHGTGKTKRIIVFAEGDKAEDARAAGADLVGGKELIDEIKASGKTDFDIAIATPDMMKFLAAVARVLGPKGLMPSPKNDTVTTHIKAAVEDVKKGKISFKNDDTGNVHQVIGKRSFDDSLLVENFTAFTDALKKARPAAAKGAFIAAITLASSMGPGIKVQV